MLVADFNSFPVLKKILNLFLNVRMDIEKSKYALKN